MIQPLENLYLWAVMDLNSDFHPMSVYLPFFLYVRYRFYLKLAA
jgi:hypothetical protein